MTQPIDPSLVRPVAEQVAETARINERLRSELEHERERSRRLARMLRRYRGLLRIERMRVQLAGQNESSRMIPLYPWLDAK